MRALCIVHEPGETPALIGGRLAERGIDMVEVMVTTEPGNPVGSADFGDPGDHDLIVAMGSDHCLHDAEPISSWLPDELDFLRRADEVGVPVLGVCFGAQALAVAHGGRCERAARPQIGWIPIDPLDGADALTGPWFSWHEDRFEPPGAATLLAADDIGAQAFRLRRNLGVQFHPEVTPEHLDCWIELGGVEPLERHGLAIDDLRAETERWSADAARRCASLVDWFLDHVATG